MFNKIMRINSNLQFMNQTLECEPPPKRDPRLQFHLVKQKPDPPDGPITQVVPLAVPATCVTMGINEF